VVEQLDELADAIGLLVDEHDHRGGQIGREPPEDRGDRLQSAGRGHERDDRHGGLRRGGHGRRLLPGEGDRRSHCARNYSRYPLLAMELGLATFADLPAGVSARQRMQDLIEEAILADELGLDVFAIGEHHRADFVVSSPAIALAAAPSRRSASASPARSPC
jgi:hypothetical protein